MPNLKQLFDTELEIAAFGIGGIILLETIALLKGMNGTMFGASMAAVGVVIGWVFKSYVHKVNKK